MESNFVLRGYRKQRIIQLKPDDDRNIHFTLIRCDKKGDNAVTDTQFDDIYKRIRECIYDNLLCNVAFMPIKACENCTYGRMNVALEALIITIRKQYNLKGAKDLPIDDPQHHHLMYTEKDWTVENPIMLHISHKGNNDELSTFLKKGEKGPPLTIRIVGEK